MKIEKTFELDYAHLLELDYDSKCQSLHGHTARITIEFTGLPNKNGMVEDYTRFPKAVLMEMDHKLLVPPQFLEKLHVDEWRVNYGSRVMDLPPSDVYELTGCLNSTAEEIARHIFDKLRRLGYGVSRVTFSETPATKAHYP